jgi:hypothetical protein
LESSASHRDPNAQTGEVRNLRWPGNRYASLLAAVLLAGALAMTGCASAAQVAEQPGHAPGGLTGDLGSDVTAAVLCFAKLAAASRVAEV